MARCRKGVEVRQGNVVTELLDLSRKRFLSTENCPCRVRKVTLSLPLERQECFFLLSGGSLLAAFQQLFTPGRGGLGF